MSEENLVLLRQMNPSNLLSFGPDTGSIPLKSLNVLIGPNGSGKSNLIESVALMRATAGDIRAVVSGGGGVNEWIWKGAASQAATFDAVINYPGGRQPLRHTFSFRAENQSFQLEDERIENESPYSGEAEPYFYYRYQRGRPMLNVAGGGHRQLERESVAPDESILVQRRDPETYPEISYLASVYGKIRIYREWAFGRKTVFREPQKADLRLAPLEEDYANLGLFLNYLRGIPQAKTAILKGLADLYEGLDDFDVSVKGGTVQVFLTEGNFTIPATRLSDGTMRYLCLLAILCDPNPPPLICLEEPELGLHPDILPKLADLLCDAAERTQLVVTTHSDILVDALTEQPETILICEKHAGQTIIKRLEPDKLRPWLERYRLGELWTRGEVGGTRW